MDGMDAMLLDVDGCLVAGRSGSSEGYYDGLRTISQFGGKVPISFCTGRDRNYVEATAGFLGWPDCWSVIESGIALFNPRTKSLIFNPLLTEAKRMVFENTVKQAVERFLARYPSLFLYPGNMFCIAIERLNGGISITEVFEEMQAELGEYAKKGFITITHSDVAVDIAPAGISKASGVEFLLKKTPGLNPDRILGIGDSNGDLSFMKKVGMVGCPANANTDCKTLVRDKGGHVSPYPHARGVADVISHFAGQGS